MSNSNNYERCNFCGCKTGRAGRGEDSIFIEIRDGVEVGPLCKECCDGIQRPKEAQNQIVEAFDAIFELIPDANDSKGKPLSIADKIRILSTQFKDLGNAARAVTRNGSWLSPGADNYDYMGQINNVVGTDWNKLVAAVASFNRIQWMMA